MKKIKFALISMILLTAASCSQAQKTTDAEKIYGDWTGESICADKANFPACKDEKVVYHFSKSAAGSGLIHVAADKIVNGENQPMGEFDLAYDPANQTLSTDTPNNQNRQLVELKLSGDRMDGTLKTLPDKMLVRKISVARKN